MLQKWQVWAFDFGLLFFFVNFPFYTFGWSSGGGTLQRLARACFCFCVFVIWLLSSLSVGCSLLVFFLFVWSFRLFGSWLVPLRQYSSSKFPSFYPPPLSQAYAEAVVELLTALAMVRSLQSALVATLEISSSSGTLYSTVKTYLDSLDYGKYGASLRFKKRPVTYR